MRVKQQIVVLTRDQQFVQADLGVALEDYLAHQYTKDGRTLSEIAAALHRDPATISRWLRQFGIEARRQGRRAA